MNWYKELKHCFEREPDFYIRHWCDNIVGANQTLLQELDWKCAEEFVIIMDQVLCEDLQ